MAMSVQETSRWIEAAALLLVFGVYFVQVLPHHGPDVAPGDVARFALALCALVILQVVGQASLAIARRRELSRGVQQDERDAWIALRATRIGARVLAVGAFAALCTALLVPGNFAFVHVLFGAWVTAHLADVLAQIALYRRGA